MTGSTRAALNDTPERSFMVQGWATRPETLTGTPWRMAWDGTPGTLTASRSAEPSPMARSWMTYRGSPFSSALGRRVSKSTSGSGARAHRNAMADVSIGSFTADLLEVGPAVAGIVRSISHVVQTSIPPSPDSGGRSVTAAQRAGSSYERT